MSDFGRREMSALAVFLLVYCLDWRSADTRMIPIRDDNPQLKIPVVTYLLIGLNILAWFTLQGMGQEPGLSESICRLGLIPADLLGTLGNTPVTEYFCPIDEQADWVTVLSSMFMHGSWMHLIGNMWFLWIFGDNVEDSMGPVRFAIFYVLCGLAAAAAQIIADAGSPIPMVGASGAIGGVMGAYIVLYPRVHVHLFMYFTTVAVPAIFMLGYWLLVQVIGGLGSLGVPGGGVAFWAHLGGFIAGALLVLVFKNPALLAAHPYHGWKQRRHATDAWHKVNRRRR